MLTILAASAALTDIDPLPAAWDLSEAAHHRRVVHSELQVPSSAPGDADRSRETAARTVSLGLVLDCVGRGSGARAGSLRCAIEDASVAGTTPFLDERSRMYAALEEIDARLTGADLDLMLRPDGRLRTVRLSAPRGPSDARTQGRDEASRTLVLRALAGFDLVIPSRGFIPGGWPQFDAAVFDLPSPHGTFAAGELGDDEALTLAP